MKVINVIQTRMGSTRLPGKSMIELLPGMTLIEMVIRRVMKSKLPDRTVLATSINADCDPLCEIAKRLGCDFIRGSEEDVLSRFVEVAEKYQLEAIVRVCADNPFVSPVEIDKLIKFFNNHNFDYAYNNDPEACGLPDGFGTEIVKSQILKNLYSLASSIQKEHVTKYILDNSCKYYIGCLRAEKKLYYPRVKLDIDTFENLNQRQSLCEYLESETAPYWSSENIIDFVLRLEESI